MLRAILILHRKRRFDDGAISELKLWRVPKPVRGSSHAFKYSLFYGCEGQRQIGYDNEAGKGDHRHYGGRAQVAVAKRRKFATMTHIKVIVGGTLDDDGAAFLDAWHRSERGEAVDECVLAFESWEALTHVLTGERYRMLCHVHKHPEPSVSALARALGRQYRRVHADVTALEQAGLLDRSQGFVRATTDRISADIRL